MKRIVFSIFLGLTLVADTTFAADESWLTQLKQRFQDYWQKQQPEKIYLHTDRKLYLASDTVWFKAYLTDARTNKPLTGSEVAYLNLFSSENKSVLAQKLKFDKGGVAGNFILPDSLKSGRYLLQVYTNWQRNSGPESFFRQPLWINSPVPAENNSVVKSAEKVLQNVQFYPESGSLHENLETKVGFKATAADGTPVQIQGQILDESGNIITTFRSNNAGIGSFKFLPQASKIYTAQVSDGKNKGNFALPVTQKGYAFTVKNRADSVWVTLAGSESNPEIPLYFALQSHGNLLFSDSLKLNANGFRKLVFSAKTWTEGIVQATLFNATGIAAADRLFFHSPAQQLEVKLEPSKKMYGRREQILVNLTVLDGNRKPVEAELSVAVTSGIQPASSAIKGNLLLSSEISSSVHNPENYLSNTEALDDLLLTQTSRSFSWANLQKEMPAPQFKRETELREQGYALLNGVPVNNAIIYLLETQSGKTHIITSNAEGKFSLPDANVARYFYQVWKGGINQREAILQMETSETVLPTEIQQVAFVPDSTAISRLILHQKITKAYGLNEKLPKVVNENADVWPVYPADKYYPLEEYNEFNNMEEIFREIVPNVRIRKKKNQLEANIYNTDRKDFFPHQPLYIIDGQPTWNSDLFLRLDASQVKQVNVYYSNKLLEPFGFMGNQGVIVIFTKSGNYQSPELRSENILKVLTQSGVNQFPTISRPVRDPDFRPTLYWNPSLSTSPEGKAGILFRTSDEMRNLRVQVEGITKDGKLISEQLLIPVQPAE